MTLLNAEEAAPPGLGLPGAAGRPGRGFLDCRGEWQRIDEDEDGPRATGGDL